jgi:hypothetical protein
MAQHLQLPLATAIQRLMVREVLVCMVTTVDLKRQVNQSNPRNASRK